LAHRPPSFFLVTTGLDPVVHAEVRLTMGCRIKSGNDEWGGAGDGRPSAHRFNRNKTYNSVAAPPVESSGA
jgi:hypothetical protein